MYKKLKSMYLCKKREKILNTLGKLSLWSTATNNNLFTYNLEWIQSSNNKVFSGSYFALPFGRESDGVKSLAGLLLVRRTAPPSSGASVYCTTHMPQYCQTVLAEISPQVKSAVMISLWLITKIVIVNLH